MTGAGVRLGHDGRSQSLPAVHLVRFRRAPRALRDEGLEGWVVVEIGVVRVDGVALRRTRRGALVLSFPRRNDASGRTHAIVAPLHADARRHILAEVLRQLGLDGEAAP